MRRFVAGPAARGVLAVGMRTWAASLVAAALLAAAADVAGAPCCGTGYGVGQRLATAETAAVTLSFRGQSVQGSFADDGHWTRARSTDTDRELRVELAAIVKPLPSLQLGAGVPFLATSRTTVDLSGSGRGLGDVNLFGRWDFVPVGGRGSLPGLAATLSFGLPTGRAPERATDVLGADTTGLGAFEVRPGLALEKAWWQGWFVVLATSVGLRAPHEGRTGTVQLGPRWSTVVAGGPSFRSGLGVALGLQHDREAAPTIAGVRGVGRARTTALLVASWELDLHWSIVTVVQADVPIAGLSRNEPGALSATLGVRLARSVYD